MREWMLYQDPDPEVLAVTAAAYNEWIAEFCAAEPARLKGLAILDAENVDTNIAQLERARALGLSGGIVAVAPLAGQEYESPRYEPFWEAAASLGMPLSLHIAKNRRAEEIAALDSEAAVANVDHDARTSLARMILAGVFERHPALRVNVVEFEAGWAPHFLERIDYTYAQRQRQSHWKRLADGMRPSDYFRRNVTVSFQEDPVAVLCRNLIGIENLTWGSDYPHTESTFPRSQQIPDEVLCGVSAEERRRLTRENCAALYGFEVPTSR